MSGVQPRRALTRLLLVVAGPHCALDLIESYFFFKARLSWLAPFAPFINLVFDSGWGAFKYLEAHRQCMENWFLKEYLVPKPNNPVLKKKNMFF